MEAPDSVLQYRVSICLWQVLCSGLGIQQEAQGGASYISNYSHVIPCSLELRYECRRRGGSKVSAGGGEGVLPNEGKQM